MKNAGHQGRSLWGSKQEAVRPRLPARLLIHAPPGGGKTFTSLSIADRFRSHWGGRDVTVIDTEQQQGKHTASVTYADIFDFELVPWPEALGYDPRDLTATIKDASVEASEDSILVIDGVQPFWSGAGGILALVGRFGDWADVRPIQAAMLTALKTYPGHLILTVRGKLAWSVQEYEDERGLKKQRVDPMGTGIQFDSNLLYEMNVVLEMDKGHTATVTKTRTGRLADRYYEAGQIDRFTDEYAEWLEGGLPVIGQTKANSLVQVFDRIESPDTRVALKAQFSSEFGLPNLILVEDYERAMLWIEEHVPATGDPLDLSVGDDEAFIARAAVQKAKAKAAEAERAKAEAAEPEPEPVKKATRKAAKKAPAKRATKKSTARRPARAAHRAPAEPEAPESTDPPQEAQKAATGPTEASEERQALLDAFVSLSARQSVEAKVELAKCELWPLREIAEASIPVAMGIIRAAVESEGE